MIIDGIEFIKLSGVWYRSNKTEVKPYDSFSAIWALNEIEKLQRKIYEYENGSEKDKIEMEKNKILAQIALQIAKVVAGAKI